MLADYVTGTFRGDSGSGADSIFMQWLFFLLRFGKRPDGDAGGGDSRSTLSQGDYVQREMNLQFTAVL